MEGLLDLHAVLAWVVILGNAMAGVWCLAASRWAALRRRAMWWFVAIVEIAVFVQVAIGVGMVSGYDAKVEQFHMFYGFVAIIAIAIIYSYRQQLIPRIYPLYGFGSLFLMGLGIRAMLKA